MKKENKLFDLIKSFNKTEKSFFKKYARFYSTEEPKLYLELFDLLEKQVNYNEKAIKAQLSDKIFIQNLSTRKNYLYDLLLKCLRNYHASKTARIKIRELYTNALILSDRRLNTQALQLLFKARKIAERYQLKHELGGIILFQRKLTRGFTEKKTTELIKNYQDDYQKNLEALIIEQKLRIYYENIFIIGRNENTVTGTMDDLFEAFNSFYDNNLLDKNLKFEEKSITCFLRANYHNYKGDFDMVSQQYQKLMDFFTNNSHFKKEYQLRYIGLLINLLSNSLRETSFDKIPQIICELEQITPRNSQMKIAQLENIFYAKITYFLGKKKYKEATKLAPEVWAFLKKFNSHIAKPRKKSLYINFAYAFFLHGDFDKSLDWLEFLLAEFNPKMRPDITFLARRMQILNHFELKNDVLLIFQMRNMQNKYRKTAYRDHIFPLTKTLKKIITPPLDQEEKLLAMLYEEVKDTRGMGDIKEWLEVRKTWENKKQPFN